MTVADEKVDIWPFSHNPPTHTSTAGPTYNSEKLNIDDTPLCAQLPLFVISPEFLSLSLYLTPARSLSVCKWTKHMTKIHPIF